MAKKKSVDWQIIDYIKSLGIDMINEAGSGHPGIVLGAAPIIYTLFSRHLIINPNDSKWPNRDRFILSAGHGSALLYATLYMAGYNLTIDDLKNFRRKGYKTPGHPEYGITPGVEVTSGPLGQGLATAVGMALGGKILQEKSVLPKEKGMFAKTKNIFNFNVYVLCSDGDLMEGISYEAVSLAGNLALDNLIVLYDSNNICLDGETKKTFTENVLDRFAALGWYTQYVRDGEDIDEINNAIIKAKRTNKPSIIEIKTTIGKGSLLAGTNEVHGKALDKEDVEQLKQQLGINSEPFIVPEDILQAFRKKIMNNIKDKYDEWVNVYNKLVNNNPFAFDLNLNPVINIDINSINWNFSPDLKEATRITNGEIMNKICELVPNLIGGSADLASSTKTYLKNYEDITAYNYKGRNIWFGVREHAMGAILSGLALTGFRPFGSTFLTFSDYLKPAIRLSAMMSLPVIYIFSHDSINIGPDGPTHQPIEQLTSLRTIPNLKVFRPTDAHELVGCWDVILNNNYPSCLVLSRADINLLPETNSQNVKYGAYIVRNEKEKLDGVIIATGSEVATAYYIANELYDTKKLDIRVVSMPCMELFLEQPKEYQEEILPIGYKKVVIEAGSSFGWHQFVYNSKYLITIDKFGISGTKDEVLEDCNFSYAQIKEKVEKLLG
ncbi:MAG: transketolase [Mollicutes bacterium]|nr:transketolase [Mollicutes bacterium]